MISLVKRLWSDRSGNTLVLTAAAMPVLIGAAGLATDTIQWALWKRELQRAADSAAIAGVYTLTQEDDQTAAQEAVCDDIARTVERADRTMADIVDECPAPEFPADDATTGAEDQVRVTLVVSKSLPFSSYFMGTVPMIRASATAGTFTQADEYCVVALESLSVGLEVTGSADVNLGDCSLISNSSNSTKAASNGTSNAISTGTNSNITAKSLAAVGFVQKNTNWDVESYDPASTAITDPFGSSGAHPLSVPTESMCDKQIGGTSNPTAFGNNNVNRSGTDVTLSDGTVLPAAPEGSTNRDSADEIICIDNGTQGGNYRGVTISGKVILGPATYVIDSGNLTMNSTGAHLQCSGCTIILTNHSGGAIGNVNITGGTLAITAPTTHSGVSPYNYQGIAIMQDPAATETISNVNSPPNPQNVVQGNNGTSIQGVVYIPGRGFKFTGGSAAASACLQIVAKRVVFTGNSSMQVMSECAGTGMSAIIGGNTARRVRLVA